MHSFFVDTVMDGKNRDIEKLLRENWHLKNVNVLYGQQVVRYQELVAKLTERIVELEKKIEKEKE